MEKLVSNSLQTFYNGKKIFITGHTGFKGSWLTSWLYFLGAQIKGYSLKTNNKLNLYNTLKGNVQFENVIGDIRDKKKLNVAIQSFKPDIIFHLAAQALVRKSYDIPSETFEVNAIGTANVLEAVNHLQKKCTVIVITSDKVYENKEGDFYYKEEDLLGGYDPYSASKAATEIVVNSFRNSFFNREMYSQHQKAIVCARAGNVIGGGDFSVDRIVPDIVRALQNHQTIELRNPNAVRPWQHVLEPLNGYLILGKIAYKNYKKVSNAYNFGPSMSDHLPVRVLVETAIQSWGDGDWKAISNPNQLHEAGLLMLDINKAKNELQWQPKLVSKEAIQWTINWYKESGNKFEFTLKQINEYQTL